MPDLVTPRLHLIMFREELLSAALEDRARLARLLGARVPAEWPNPEMAEALPAFSLLYAALPALPGWLSLIVEPTEGVLVGDIGFKGLPDAGGAVEVGYGIIPSHRGRGYATEALRAIVVWAFAQPAVLSVVAECLPDNAASIRVLQSAGFLPEGGTEMLRWRTSK
jgi:[ribosomal protein S5]-alanine N-acetyltransferase